VVGRSVTRLAKPESAPHVWRSFRARLQLIELPQETGIQDVFRHLANDKDRTAAIGAEIERAFSEGRKVLVADRAHRASGCHPGHAVWKDNGRPSSFTAGCQQSSVTALIKELDALRPMYPRPACHRKAGW